MKIMRLGDIGAELPFVVDDDGTTWSMSGLTGDVDGAFLESGGLERVRQALSDGSLPRAGDVSSLRVGPPIARPMAVVCIGMNYAEHAAESGAEPPANPVIFFKHPNTVVGPNDALPIPRGAVKVDWEVELSIVIGKRARYLATPSDSAGHIAGFTIANDVSERDYQLTLSGGQWSAGKSAEGFNPLGPYLVPTADLLLPARLTTTVNGEPRQDSSTADLIFGVDYLIWYLSQRMVLEAGDIVNTGTPRGVALSGQFPYLKPGDLIELGIEGLGVQSQRVVEAL